jgi:hypothetical protein
MFIHIIIYIYLILCSAKLIFIQCELLINDKLFIILFNKFLYVEST